MPRTNPKQRTVDKLLKPTNASPGRGIGRLRRRLGPDAQGRIKFHRYSFNV